MIVVDAPKIKSRVVKMESMKIFILLVGACLLYIFGMSEYSEKCITPSYYYVKWIRYSLAIMGSVLVAYALGTGRW